VKVILVDDERIVIEHIRQMLPWEQYDFEIVGSASNGKSALRLCKELLPQIVIVDIRMPVMDGLELIRTVGESNMGIKFIVMSSYEDFEYARKAIALKSVQCYLLKHELTPDKLLQELLKAKGACEIDQEKEKMIRNERIKDFLMGTDDVSVVQFESKKPPFVLILIQADRPFTVSGENASSLLRAFKWKPEERMLLNDLKHWQIISEFSVEAGQFAAMLVPSSPTLAAATASLRNVLAALQSRLKQTNLSYSIFYILHDEDTTTLPLSFKRLLQAARHSIFINNHALVDAATLKISHEQRLNVSKIDRFDKLNECLKLQKIDELESAIELMFKHVTIPVWDLRALHDIVNGLTDLINNKRAMKGLTEIDPLNSRDFAPIYDVQALCSRFVQLLVEAFTDRREVQLSTKLQKALRYIQEHYEEEINIDDVSYAIGISASYLHQLCKKELNQTFLDYLTDYRIHQAKQILTFENIKMAEVASKVGYRSPQHFSQLFKKKTGMLPHQYRDGGEHK
jgi:two-component system response regulator YesN